MAHLQESYLITSDDESESVSLKKDIFGNLEITLEDSSGPIGLQVSSELLPKFIHAANRLFNS